MNNFALFKKTFKRYQEKFGLIGYQVYFKHEPIDDEAFANITVNQEEMSVTVKLNSKLSESEKPFKDIRRDAKHEALHLFLFRLVDRAYSRYVQRDEIYETVEDLVIRLEKLIPDIKV